MSTPQWGSVGLFGQGPSWMPSAGHGAAPQAYDFSGITRGIDLMSKAPNISGLNKKMNPFGFKTPGLNTVSPLDMVGEGEYNNLFGSAFGAASAPIRAQGEERMRTAGQGFGGHGMGGPAQQEMIMKNAQKTGEDVRDVSRNLSSNIMNSRIQERMDMNKLSLDDRQRVRDQLFNADMTRQTQQADENYRSFGYNTDQSRYMAEDQFRRANAILDAGMQLPQIQMAGYNANQSQWNQMMQTMAMFGGFGGK